MLKIPVYWQGGLYKLFGCFCFALVNSLIRYVTGGAANTSENPLSFYQIVFLENLIGALILLPWMLRKGIKAWGTKWPAFHSMRVLSAVSGMLLWYASLKFMPITQALALSFTGPILGLLGAKIFLKEQMGKSRILAVVLSLLGAYLIIEPHAAFVGQDGLSTNLGAYVLLPILSAASFAGTKLFDRSLGQKGESPHLLTLYLLVFMAPISFIPAFFDWSTPTLNQLGIITLMSILSTTAYLSFAQGFKMASVSFLTPFGFSKLIFSATVAYLAFKELPSTWNFWLGAMFILFSILVLSYFSRIQNLVLKKSN